MAGQFRRIEDTDRKHFFPNYGRAYGHFVGRNSVMVADRYPLWGIPLGNPLWNAVGGNPFSPVMAKPVSRQRESCGQSLSFPEPPDPSAAPAVMTFRATSC
jgi:hypothetical protein